MGGVSDRRTELVVELLAYKDQSHNVELPEKTNDHSLETELAIRSLDAVELSASLGSAGSDPER